MSDKTLAAIKAREAKRAEDRKKKAAPPPAPAPETPAP